MEEHVLHMWAALAVKATYVWMEETPMRLHVRPGGDAAAQALTLVCQVPSHVRMGH